ncbi:MAG: hypothetical protein RLZZ501_2048 [Pseudomonadota bacterium]|jgi:molecular chaperone DnaK (HSP70)
MTPPRYAIGIDLGTSNSALAYAELDKDGPAEVLAVAQWDADGRSVESDTLPSALLRPDPDLAGRLGASEATWVVGRLARRMAGETPGRVVVSAKSWLAHHGADRAAAFLPWGGETLGPDERLSPVKASALILAHLRAAWDARFAARGPEHRFDAQDVTVTVPASFDPVAQRLTLDAAAAAGFPAATRLLEEPQAAFAWWLESHEDPWAALPAPAAGPGAARHVLVIDIGGGTSDFSLFALDPPAPGAAPRIRRVAVSDHILLGGDNIDLALAHRLELGFTNGFDRLTGTPWDHLVARCRDLKERVLAGDGPAEESFPVALPGHGSGLMAAARTVSLRRADLDTVLLDGFFPACAADAVPGRASGAVQTWGLPYAHDGAVTRHLAAFLAGRPPVDAVLCNGGTLTPDRLRRRLAEMIGGWQGGSVPALLDTSRLDLAVALGAACAGRRRLGQTSRIEAGSGHAVFLEVHRPGEAAALVCLLPHGTPPEREIALDQLDLRLRVNRPVRFGLYSSTRHEDTQAGAVLRLDPAAFQALPPLETVATVSPAPADAEASVPVAVTARLNPVGLLQLACRSLDRKLPHTWPLDFDLRPDAAPTEAGAEETPRLEPNLAAALIAAAGADLAARLGRPPAKGEKLAAPRLLQGLERGLGPRKDWNGAVVRALWEALEGAADGRALSVEHEEAWLTLAGYLLRPGFGVAGDAARLDALWRLASPAPRFPGKRIRLHQYLLWRRLAGGLSRERQEALLAPERDALLTKSNVSPELVRMAGAFERIGLDLKTALVERFLAVAVEMMKGRQHAAPYLAALGGLLNRTPLYAGPDSVTPPALVERAFEALGEFDWTEAEFIEAQTLFLRAARAVEDRRIDLPDPLRRKIASRLEKGGMAPTRTARLREIVPVERAERLGGFGEDLPAGLILS